MRDQDEIEARASADRTRAPRLGRSSAERCSADTRLRLAHTEALKHRPKSLFVYQDDPGAISGGISPSHSPGKIRQICEKQ